MKDKIKLRFDRAYESYEKVATVQKECAQFLTSILSKRMPDFFPASILDVGSGTGYVTKHLLPLFPTASYTLNDLSDKMLEKAQEKFNPSTQFTFTRGDMETTYFPPHDLIISNLALQWVDHLENVISKLYSQSTVLAFSCLLEGTFKEWEDIFKNREVRSPVKQYPTYIKLGQFLKSLIPLQLHYEAKEFKVQFSTTYDFMLYLRQLGASVGIAPLPPSVIKHIIETRTQPFEITYQVFFGILKRQLQQI